MEIGHLETGAGGGMAKVLAGFDRVIHKIDMLLVGLAAVLLAALIFMVGADITLRYLLDRPLGWVKEISEYIILFIPFFVAAWIMETDGHIKMDLVVGALGPGMRKKMNMVTYTIGALVVLTLASFSLRVAIEFYRTNYFTATLLRLPKCIFMAGIFLGFLMLLIQLVRKIIGFALNLEEPGQE